MSDLAAARERHKGCDTTDPCQSHEDHWAIACDFALAIEALDDYIASSGKVNVALAVAARERDDARALADELAMALRERRCLCHEWTAEMEPPVTCARCAALAKWEASKP